MNKSSLVEAVADKTGITKKSSEIILNAVLEAITEQLTVGNTVRLVGFGSFVVKRRNARKCVNPHTGEDIYVPSKQVPVFKAGKQLKLLTNRR